jgi:hypothetical protein
MGEILDAAASFFKEVGWQFMQAEGEPVLQLGVQTEHGQFAAFAQAREEQAQFIFYSVCPAKAPEDKRMVVAEFLTRANYGLAVGNFELDFEDGEIRYKTSIDVEGDRLSQPLVRQIVYTNIMMMDKYLVGILSVIYGNTSPVEAIAAVEG